MVEPPAVGRAGIDWQQFKKETVSVVLSERAAAVLFQLLNNAQIGGGILEEAAEAKAALARTLHLERQENGDYLRTSGE